LNKKLFSIYPLLVKLEIKHWIEIKLAIAIVFLGTHVLDRGFGYLCKYEVSEQNIAGLNFSSRFIGAIASLSVF